MKDDRSHEPTETDERVAENQTAAQITSVFEDESGTRAEAATGLPAGQHDDDTSPLDRGKPLDPFAGKAPSERVRAMKPGEAQEQAFGSAPTPDDAAR